MSQLDDLMKNSRDLFGYVDPAKQLEAIYNDVTSNQSLYNVTDRSQIINPEALLQQVQFLGNSANHQALYNKYLASFNNIKSQQEAIFQEYYNSTAQQVIRDREAGLNPDILGVQGSQAAQAGMNDGSPLDGIPTSEEIELQKRSTNINLLTSIVSSLSSVAGLASAFSGISLNESQKNLISSNINSNDLSNLSQLKSLIASDIDDLLATAMNNHLLSGSDTEFNIDEWFSNDSNFSHLSDIYGSYSSFKPALYQARKSVLAHRKNAVKQQFDNADAQSSFMDIYSNPRFSFEQKIHDAQLRPYITRLNSLELAKTQLDEIVTEYQKSYYNSLDPQSAASSINSHNIYDNDYYSSLDGKLVAAFESFMREVQTSSGTMSKEINDNYYKIYSANPDNIDGWRAAYLYCSNGGSSWQDAYLSNSLDYFTNMMKNNETIQNAIANNADLREKISAFGSLIGNLPGREDINKLNGIGWRQYQRDLLDFIESLQNVADNAN